MYPAKFFRVHLMTDLGSSVASFLHVSVGLVRGEVAELMRRAGDVAGRCEEGLGGGAMLVFVFGKVRLQLVGGGEDLELAAATLGAGDFVDAAGALADHFGGAEVELSYLERAKGEHGAVATFLIDVGTDGSPTGGADVLAVMQKAGFGVQ